MRVRVPPNPNPIFPPTDGVSEAYEKKIIDLSKWRYKNPRQNAFYWQQIGNIDSVAAALKRLGRLKFNRGVCVPCNQANRLVFDEDFVGITIKPTLARLGGGDDRMPSRVRVLGRVVVG